MPEEPYATRRELDMLAARVDSIDRDGTRGVIALQAQLTDVMKDITMLTSDVNMVKKDTALWFEKHGGQHEQDLKDRTSSRRWMIGTVIAGLVSMAAVLTLLVQIFQNIHH